MVYQDYLVLQDQKVILEETVNLDFLVFPDLLDPLVFQDLQLEEEMVSECQK